VLVEATTAVVTPALRAAVHVAVRLGGGHRFTVRPCPVSSSGWPC
jgi:hypothetical protein